MNFKIEEKQNIYSGSKYYEDENSIVTFGEEANCSLQIKGTYLSLDFDILTKKIIGLSGFIGELKKLKREKIIIPEYKNATLYVESSIDFLPGIGYEFELSKMLYYDKFRGIILIGNENKMNTGDCYKIAENIYVCLSDGKISKLFYTL